MADRPSFAAWVLQCNNRFHAGDHGQRQGQFFFNDLVRTYPVLAELVRGQVMDPFYVNDRLPVFLEFCCNHWED